jgi:uroporphyrinogen decarboxylase
MMEGKIRLDENFNIRDLGALRDEMVKIFKTDIPPQVLNFNHGLFLGPFPMRPFEIIEQDEDSMTFIDSWGIKTRDFTDKTSMPQYLEHPVKNMEDWKQYKKEWLDPDVEGRIGGNWSEVGKEWMKKGYPIQLGDFINVGLFGSLRWLLGDEECMISFCTQPELVHDIFDHMTSLYITVFEKIAKEIRIDIIHMFEDVCYKCGPFISPDSWKEFLSPHYRRIKQFAENSNIPILSVDTDGDPDILVPYMMEDGINYLWPMEVTGTNDVNSFREKYPDMAIMGGIDKRVLSAGPEAIDKEFERIKPAFMKGRYLPDIDHAIPDNVSWENYSYFVDALKNFTYSNS